MPKIGAPHAPTHEDGGNDEIDVTGLTGAGGGGTVFSGFYASPTSKNIGKYRVGVIDTDGEECRLKLTVPDNFSSITKAVVNVISDLSGSNINIDIFSEYGAPGEAYNNSSESDTTTTYTFVADQLYEIDISGILSDLAAGDKIAIDVQMKQSHHDLGVYSIQLEYDI